jgi:hypothetical protein
MAKPKTVKAWKPRERTNLRVKTRLILLTESGYRCAVPSCRSILALDLHHIWEFSQGGSNDPANLIALCPNCHGLYHRGTIQTESIYVYKAILVAITRAFDIEAIDQLLFFEMCAKDYLIVSGNGLLTFSRLIAAGLATMEQKANNNNQLVTYAVNISDKGKLLIKAWREGDRMRLTQVIGGPWVQGNSAN